MPRWLFRWLVTSLAILLVGGILPGVQVAGVGPAVATAAVLGVLNMLVRPILIFLTFPLTLVSLGFFILVINAFLFQLAGSFVSGVHVDSFGWAFLASLIVSVVSFVLQATDGRSGKRVVFYRGGRGPAEPPSSGGTIDLKPNPKGNWEKE